MAQPLDLECPANYFGKGEHYTLPDDPDVLMEFNRRFAEWEAAHPEDPTGDIALEEWKRDHPIPKGPVGLPTTPTPVRREATEEKDSGDWKELELVMPEKHIERLKNYARFVRRRPRDVVMLWIEQYAKF